MDRSYSSSGRRSGSATASSTGCEGRDGIRASPQRHRQFPDGIDPELSGYENIDLRGLYLGLNKSEINERMEEVIAFTELGPFIEMPFRSYSAGMRAIEAEILLLDEGLGAGDTSFIEKANEARREARRCGRHHRGRHPFGSVVASDLH
jgi:ABC-type polysaccharide/polyol phosphate transport system ATPase subunit